MTDQERVYEAVCAGHKSAVEIAKATGISEGTVYSSIASLRTVGKIEAYRGGGNGWYRPTQKCLLAEVWTGVRRTA